MSNGDRSGNVTQFRNYQGSGGGGGMMDTNERLVALETHFGYIQRDLSEIKTSLGGLHTVLHQLPTKRDLDTWKWQWVGLSITVIILTVGGIVGGLALINRSVDVKPPAPIVLQIPTPQAAPAPR